MVVLGLATRKLDLKVGKRRTIRLGVLRKLGPIECRYSELATTVTAAHE